MSAKKTASSARRADQAERRIAPILISHLGLGLTSHSELCSPLRHTIFEHAALPTKVCSKLCWAFASDTGFRGRRLASERPLPADIVEKLDG